MSFDYAQDGDFCTDRHSALGRFMIRYCHRSQGGGHDAASDWPVELARWGAFATSRAPSCCPFGNLGAGGLVAVRNGAEGCSQCGEGGTLLSAADDVQGRAAAALVRVVGPGDGGGAVRPDQLSALRGVVERGRDAGPYDDLALSREARDGWGDRPSARRAVGATRGAGSDGEARDVDRCLDRAERGAPAARGRRQGQPKRSRRALLRGQRAQALHLRLQDAYRGGWWFRADPALAVDARQLPGGDRGAAIAARGRRHGLCRSWLRQPIAA